MSYLLIKERVDVLTGEALEKPVMLYFENASTLQKHLIAMWEHTPDYRLISICIGG